MNIYKKLLAPLALLFMVGCADKTTVTLLPEEGGKVGKIAFVDKSGKSVTIDKAWEKLEVKKDGSASSEVSDEKAVMGKYKDTISAMPPKPLTYFLFFGAESAELNDESIRMLDAAVKEIAAKKANLVVCAGHSDSLGEKEYNMALSLKRAESAARYLIKHGVSKEIIEVRYYADSNPLVKTPHGVPHPKNRRVEVVVK
ncbi:MAG: OmpA family protein [Campylobacterales bacterium]